MAAVVPAPLPRVGRSSGSLAETLSIRAFTVPLLVVFGILIGYPLVQSIWWSFTNFNGYSTEYDFVGLDNYFAIARTPSMLGGLGFSLGYTIATTLLITAIAIPLAVILNRTFFGRGFVRSVLFFPSIPSAAILGLVWAFILSPLPSGAVNSVLINVFSLAPVPWLANGTLAQISIVLVSVWAHAGWHAILYLAYLQSIPSDIYEVAIVDGASAIRRFFAITLPLLAPAVTISWLLLITSGLKVYDLPFTLTGGGPGYSTYTITQSMIQSGISEARFGQASALSVVFMIIVGAVVALQLALSRRMEERVS